MASHIRIHDRAEIDSFVRTHLGHRLSALVSPICRPEHEWPGRNDAYRAAKEGSFVMLRLFIEFLGVKTLESAGNVLLDRQVLDNKRITHKRPPDIWEKEIVLSCFENSVGRLPNLIPANFDTEQDLITRVHQKLSKVTAHFTYDVPTAPVCYDRITSIPDADWQSAVEKVVRLLDKHFYHPLKHFPIVVHWDLVEPFKRKFPSLITKVEGGDLGR